MAHGDEQSSDEGSSPRSIRRHDGRSDAASGDAEVTSVDAAPDDDDQGERGPYDSFQIAQSFTGPLPPVPTLNGYDQIVPGSARQIIDAHLRREKVAADAIERLTRSEAFAVVVGTLGAQALTVGGLVLALYLLSQGYSLGAIGAFIPSFLGASALVVSAWRKGRSD